MDNDIAALVRGELQRISTDVDRGLGANKDRIAETRAELLDLQQRVARRGDSGSGGPIGGAGGHRLSEAAGAIAGGLRDSNSIRHTLDFSVRAATAPPPASLDGSDFPAIPIGPVSTYHPALGRLINLLPVRPVDSGNAVTFNRVTYKTGSGEGNNAAAVAELADKPQSSVATTPITLDLVTYAHWVEVSKQVLDDVPELQAILDGILRGGLLDVVDAAIYAAMTTAGSFTAFTPTATETAGDGVARAAAAVAVAGGTRIIVALNPSDYLTMNLARASTAGTYLGTPANLADRVVAVAAVTQGKVLAFSQGSGASWAERQQTTVIAGLTSTQFTRNAISLLAECRGATLIRDPGHIYFGNLVSGG